jgi:hypothetical protein
MGSKGVPGPLAGPRSPALTSEQGAAAVGRTRAARATKYIEFHGGVRWPHVYFPARRLHSTEKRVRAAGRR